MDTTLKHTIEREVWRFYLQIGTISSLLTIVVGLFLEYSDEGYATFWIIAGFILFIWAMCVFYVLYDIRENKEIIKGFWSNYRKVTSGDNDESWSLTILSQLTWNGVGEKTTKLFKEKRVTEEMILSL